MTGHVDTGEALLRLKAARQLAAHARAGRLDHNQALDGITGLIDAATTYLNPRPTEPSRP